MSDNNLPLLPEHTGYMAHDYGLKAWDERDLRAYAAQAVAERDAEIAAEQRRSEMYVDLVRRTAEALGQPLWAGWHKLPERVEALRADADKHYAAGWRTAAKWAERDDLISDIDSPAYIADRDAAIDSARGQE